MGRASDLTGQTFGDFTALRRGPNKGHRAVWICACAVCDEEHSVQAQHLRSSRPNRCPKTRTWAKVEIPGMVDDAAPSERGGREHTAWRRILSCCLRPEDSDYAKYGGAGVLVDPSWLRFSAYRADVGPCPSDDHYLTRLDRDYGPDLTTWQTRKEQARRRSNVVLVEQEGETRCVAEWPELYGLPAMLLHHRLAWGWDFVEAVETRIGYRGSIRHEGVEYPNLAALARAHGVPPARVARRLRSGLSLSQALNPAKAYRPSRTIDYDGRTYPSIAEFCRHYGLDYQDTLDRLKRAAWDPAAAFVEVPRKTYEYRGVEYPSLAALARAQGVSTSRLYKRLDAGWRLDEAVDKPVQQRRKK